MQDIKFKAINKNICDLSSKLDDRFHHLVDLIINEQPQE